MKLHSGQNQLGMTTAVLRCLSKRHKPDCTSIIKTISVRSAPVQSRFRCSPALEQGTGDDGVPSKTLEHVQAWGGSEPVQGVLALPRNDRCANLCWSGWGSRRRHNVAHTTPPSRPPSLRPPLTDTHVGNAARTMVKPTGQCASAGVGRRQLLGPQRRHDDAQTSHPADPQGALRLRPDPL